MKKRITLGAVSITALPIVVAVSCGTNKVSDKDGHIKIITNQTITPKTYNLSNIDSSYKIDKDFTNEKFTNFVEKLTQTIYKDNLTKEEFDIWNQLTTKGTFSGLENAIQLKDEAKINTNLLKIKKLLYGSIIPFEKALKEQVITLTYTGKDKKDYKLEINIRVKTSNKLIDKTWDSILKTVKLKVSDTNNKLSLMESSLRASAEMLEETTKEMQAKLKLTSEKYHSFIKNPLIIQYAKDKSITNEDALNKILNLKFINESIKTLEKQIIEIKNSISNL